jgi:hypothetical protein
MREFWRSSGYHLLQRTSGGRLAVTDEFLRAYLRRNELAPVPESCDGERALHTALLDNPRLAVTDSQIARIADPDARDNYILFLPFRDQLLGHDTIESAYLALFRTGDFALPPLFLDQLVHVILRNLLEGVGDPVRVRAAELLFRAQQLTRKDGAIMLADEETIAMRAQAGGAAGSLVAENGKPGEVSLDILDSRNAGVYWDRADRFDTVLNISFGQPGLDALCRVLESWIAHMLGVAVRVQPVERIRDERWVWHVGLDAEATAILNDLYDGMDVAEDRLARMVSLFRLEFDDARDMATAVSGRPIYLGMAIDARNVLRLKPQNLLVNLPLREQS